MRNSLKLFTWLGIPVYIHWSFGLIFLYILYIANRQGYNGVETLWFTGLFLSLFACVLLHEYGHAMAARRYGVGTRDIVLMPIGGMARLEKMPEKPWHEFVVALAGPLVNVAIALVLGFAVWAAYPSEQLEMLRYALEDVEFGESLTSSRLLRYTVTLILSNVVLVIFNLIPAFPMDGGRVLRALLAMRIGRPRATRIASVVGQIIAFGFVLLGLYSENYMLAILGIFVIMAARNENAAVQTETLWEGFSVGDVMRRDFRILRADQSVAEAFDLLRQGSERHFLVLYPDQGGGSPIGAVNEDALYQALAQRNLLIPLGDLARQVPILSPRAPLSEAAAYLMYSRHDIVAVSDASGSLIGALDTDDLQRFRRLREVWRQSPLAVKSDL